MYRILFVCTGNVCRSVIAEKVLRRELAAAGVSAEVASAGLRTEVPGAAADSGAAAVLAARSFDPAAGAGWDVPDPVGGDSRDYERTFRLIMSAMPGRTAAIVNR